MKTVKPWNKEAEKYLRQLAKDRVAYTKDINFTRSFGRRYPELLDKDNGFMDIARIDKRKESMLVLRPGVGIAPIPSAPSIHSKFMKFNFYKIY